jgi:DNA polymerase-3 subunit chi
VEKLLQEPSLRRKPKADRRRIRGEKLGMSAVDFHTHLADPLQYTCRLLRKVYASGAWVQVRCAPAWLAKLNSALWTFSPLEFLAHAGEGASGSVVMRSQVLLVSENSAVTWPGMKQRDVLINLGCAFDPLADWVSAHRRVIELVSQDPGDLAAARSRFKAYRDAGVGHQLNNYDQRAA